MPGRHRPVPAACRALGGVVSSRPQAQLRDPFMFRFRRFTVALLAVFLLPLNCRAQGLEEVKARYTKFEYRIPMRDGVKLFTAVYVPKDEDQRYPILLVRTPYSVRPYGVDQYRRDLGPSPQFAKEGYIFVYQDVRGRWMSEGEFVNMRPHRPKKTSSADVDESTDT